MLVDDGLRDPLLQLSPSARDHLRTVLIRDDRDEIAQQLLRYGDANGDGWADSGRASDRGFAGPTTVRHSQPARTCRWLDRSRQ